MGGVAAPVRGATSARIAAHVRITVGCRHAVCADPGPPSLTAFALVRARRIVGRDGVARWACRGTPTLITVGVNERGEITGTSHGVGDEARTQERLIRLEGLPNAGRPRINP